MTLYTVKKFNFYTAMPLKSIVFHYQHLSWKAEYLGAAQYLDICVCISNLIVLF